MKTTRLSLDVDGTVANYRKSYADIVKALDLPRITQPVGVGVETAAAMIEERQDLINTAVHDWIQSNLPQFFGEMECMLTEEDKLALHALPADAIDLYFITGRSVHISDEWDEGEVHSLTHRWLRDNGVLVLPERVIVTRDKAQAVNDHAIKFHLDDLVPHATQIALRTEAQVYLIRRPWNRHIIFQQPGEETDYRTSAAGFGTPEVDSIGEFCDIVRFE